MASLASAAALLAACGGDGGGTGPDTNPTDDTPALATLVRVSAEAAGSHCAAGGVQVQSGLDADSNGVLADSEVSSTQYVCNGTDGSTGSSGLSTLVRVRTEAAGSQCAQGGSAVLAGFDANSNGVLEDSEVSSTSYVCNGSTGATGATGSSGYDSLVTLSTEAAGANCTYGGQRVQSGLDTNRNGVLDITEVSATSFICSAAPADTQWVNVTGSSVQAVSNTGYLANASSLVTITLPSSPTIGDWIKVTGVGTGGWTLAQNAGQRITTRGLPGGMDITWTAEALTGTWAAVAMSADGTRQVATSTTGQLYTSTDSGGIWVQRLVGQVWSSVASSADGLKLVATTNGGSLYMSTDGGVSWINDGTARAWSGVTSSADGTHMVAVAYMGNIWTSADSGASWIARESSRAWRSVASSSDGRVIVAGTSGNQLWVSTDFGTTWTARASTQYWWGLAASADGKRLYATVDSGTIWTSTDYGTTWETQTINRAWRGITTSSDGRFVVAATDGGALYESTDYGTNWRASGDSGTWAALAGSSDGLTLLAGKSGSALYAGSRRSSTTLGVTGSISGGQEDALQLQYVGGGVFMPINYVSASLTFTVR